MQIRADLRTTCAQHIDPDVYALLASSSLLCFWCGVHTQDLRKFIITPSSLEPVIAAVITVAASDGTALKPVVIPGAAPMAPRQGYSAKINTTLAIAATVTEATKHQSQRYNLKGQFRPGSLEENQIYSSDLQATALGSNAPVRRDDTEVPALYPVCHGCLADGSCAVSRVLSKSGPVVQQHQATAFAKSRESVREALKSNPHASVRPGILGVPSSAQQTCGGGSKDATAAAAAAVAAAAATAAATAAAAAVEEKATVAVKRVWELARAEQIKMDEIYARILSERDHVGAMTVDEREQLYAKVNLGAIRVVLDACAWLRVCMCVCVCVCVCVSVCVCL